MRGNTHHCSNFRPSPVVNKGQHKRRQEEEEGADSRVNQVLQEGNGTTGRSKFNFKYIRFKTYGFNCEMLILSL